jgi:hypothetical protein
MLSQPNGREAKLVEFHDSKELKAWLKGQPREVCVAIAARAALRVLPFLGEALRHKPVYIVLPVFRALSFAWANASYSNPLMGSAAATIDLGQFGLASRAATDAAAAAQGARATVFNSSLAAGVFNFASDAVSGFASKTAYAIISEQRNPVPNSWSRGNRLRSSMPPADTPEFYQWEKRRLEQEQSITSFYAQLEPTFWSNGSIDATQIEKGTAASEIARAPLWPQGQPEALKTLWKELAEALRAANEDWDVWIDWYENRLAGRVHEEARELAYVDIDETLWNQGPAIVNAAIKQRIEELEQETPPIAAIPPQEPLATRFGINAAGLIDVIPDPPVPGNADDALQREFYAEMSVKAGELIALGSNQLGDLNGPSQRFQDALKNRIEDVSIPGLWSRANTLRIRLRAHDLSLNSAEPDTARLPPLVAETLRDLVHTWNIFNIGDAKGRELDEIRLGPEEVQAAKQVVAAGAPVIAALKDSENVATPAAMEAVAEQAEAAKAAPPGIDGDQANELSRKTTGNFVSEMLRIAYRLVGKGTTFVGKEIVAGALRKIGGDAVADAPQLIALIVQIPEELKNFVTTAWHDPALADIIDRITQFFK